MKRTISHSQRLVIVDAMLCFASLLVILQLWLFTATMESYLGGDNSTIWPAALVSLGCLGLNAGLLFHLYRLGRSYEAAQGR